MPKKKSVAAVKKATRAAVTPKPLLNVVPLDDVTRLIDERLSAHLAETQKLVDAAAHPMMTVNKPETVGPSTSTRLPVGSTNPFFDDVKPILLSDSYRIALETLFGGEPLSKPEDVIRLSNRLSNVRLLGPDGEACSVVIPLDTLERLEARRPVDTTLKEMVERGFSDYLEGLINGVF